MGDQALDAIARGLASGMSRREALRKGGIVLAAAVAMSPSDAWAKVTGRCPHHRVNCNGKCCPAGEVCLHPKKRKGARRRPKPKCGCPANTKRCRGKCVHYKTDANNCGSCGNHCPSGHHCVNGKCACPTGETTCNGTCVDTTTDPANCGGCGKACAAGTACVFGSCLSSCPAGTVACGSACVKLGSDATNCGACGTVCPPGQACVDGTCSSTCPTGLTLCGNACVDLQGDGANCGACGTACTAGNVCANGACAGSCPTGSVTCSASCCHGTACCGSGCQTVHANGVGQNYYDCGSLGVPGNAATYSLALSQEAANAFAPGATSHICSGEQALIVSNAGGAWATWVYTGSLAGRVKLNSGGPLCPDSASPTWD